MIPILNLTPDQKMSADQIVLVANGKLHVLTDGGEKVGIRLPSRDRPLLHDAIAQGYLKCYGKQTRLKEVFCHWCDAKEIPCVTFEVENDCVDILTTNDPVEDADPYVTLHFDVVTAWQPFTKPGLVAVTEILLGKFWKLVLSPWKISAGVLPLNQARQILTEVYRTWDTTRKANSENGSSFGEGLESCASHTIQ